MFHLADFASVFAITMMGARHVFIPRFLPTETLQAIEQYKVTHTILVPTMFAMILQLDVSKYDVSSIVKFIYGASAMPESLLLGAMAAFPTAKFIQGYGMTECSPVNTFLTEEYHVPGNPKLSSVGRAVSDWQNLFLFKNSVPEIICWTFISETQNAKSAHVDARIVDEQGNEVPRGVVGELIVRGPHVMKGYYNMPETTANTIKNGWMHTGDGQNTNTEAVFINSTPAPNPSNESISHSHVQLFAHAPSK